MQYLRADTVTEITIGPSVAVGDGFTPVTTLTIAGADEAEIIKHGATTTTSITGTLAAITGADGYYALDLVVGDVDTEGRLTVLINDDSLILPIRMEFMVVNANVFDSLFAASTTDYLQVDTIQVSGATEDISTETKQDIIDTNVDSILADTGELQTNQGNWLTATGFATPTNITAGTITTVSGNVNGSVASVTAGVIVTTNNDKTGYSLTQAFPANFAALGISVGGAIDNVTLTATCTNVTNLHANSATSAAQTTAQNDLDILTGTDGVTLATSQLNYTPNTVVPDNAGIAGIQTDLDNATDGLGAIKAAVDTKASQVSVDDVPTVSELNARTILSTDYFDPATDTVANVSTVATLTGHIAQTADHTAAIDDVPTVAEFEARTPTAAQLLYIIENAGVGYPVTFTTSGGTTTNAVLNLVDGSGASATPDQYNGRLLVFTDGTLKGVVTDITDYDGANNATITAIPVAPTSSHNARLI